MHDEIAMVKAFHLKHSFPVGIKIGESAETDLVRVHLIAEELGELALALAQKNIVKTADALADLIYVVVGTAVAYDIPLSEVFREVQQSNMTKAPRDPNDTRLRTKGDSYRPPDIIGVLREHGFQIFGD